MIIRVEVVYIPHARMSSGEWAMSSAYFQYGKK